MGGEIPPLVWISSANLRSRRQKKKRGEREKIEGREKEERKSGKKRRKEMRKRKLLWISSAIKIKQKGGKREIDKEIDKEIDRKSGERERIKGTWLARF